MHASIVILNACLQLIWYDSSLKSVKTQCNTGIQLSMHIMWWCWLSRNCFRQCASSVVYVLCQQFMKEPKWGVYMYILCEHSETGKCYRTGVNDWLTECSCISVQSSCKYHWCYGFEGLIVPHLYILSWLQVLLIVLRVVCCSLPNSFKKVILIVQYNCEICIWYDNICTDYALCRTEVCVHIMKRM
jgi:hypothetical protein